MMPAEADIWMCEDLVFLAICLDAYPDGEDGARAFRDDLELMLERCAH